MLTFAGAYFSEPQPLQYSSSQGQLQYPAVSGEVEGTITIDTPKTASQSELQYYENHQVELYHQQIRQQYAAEEQAAAAAAAVPTQAALYTPALQHLSNSGGQLHHSLAPAGQDLSRQAGSSGQGGRHWCLP